MPRLRTSSSNNPKDKGWSRHALREKSKRVQKRDFDLKKIRVGVPAEQVETKK
jgi:hypothetical protein